MHPLIAVSVVKVPMCVDEVFDGIAIDGCKRFTDLWTRADVAGVNKKLAVGTGKNSNVPSCAHQDTYVPAEFLDPNAAGSRCSPGHPAQLSGVAKRWRGLKQATPAAIVGDARK